jgi:hypothetical protein
MSLLIGPLFARRKDNHIFSWDKATQRAIEKHGGVDQINYDFVTFWDTVNQHMYLNQSANLRETYKNFNEDKIAYNDETNPREEKDKIGDRFQRETRPAFIKAIEDRYQKITTHLQNIENRLKIQDEDAKILH